MFEQPDRTHTGVPCSPARLRAWVVRAGPGERLEYYRGFLAIDRVKDTSALNELERRKLATVAEHALALAERGVLRLLQERHGKGDYSYWAVVGTPARSIAPCSCRLSMSPCSESKHS
jgi:hypothetical protein